MNLRPPRLFFSYGFLVAVLILSGCATQSNAPQLGAAADQEEFNDPLEDTNRAIFDFNQGVDRNVLVPVAKAYRTVLPDPVRDALRDFLRNLRGPLIYVCPTRSKAISNVPDKRLRALPSTRRSAWPALWMWSDGGDSFLITRKILA